MNIDGSDLFDRERETVDWELVLQPQVGIGEVPTWAGDESRLYWIDVFAGTLNRTDPDTGQTDTWATGETIGCFGLIADRPSALVALLTGLYELNLENGSKRLLHAAPYDTARFRFNDGRCDPQGRFWVGTNPLAGVSPRPVGESAFWRLEDDGLHIAIEQTTIANGIAFDPARAVMYIADDPSRSLLAFDYDAVTGAATNRRTFARVPGGLSLDGAAIDTEGRYWIALPKAGLVACFEPDGSLHRLLEAPTSFPTMVCFGGPQLRDLYVTTGRWDYDGVTSEPDPRAGGIFRRDVGAQGTAEPRITHGVPKTSDMKEKTL